MDVGRTVGVHGLLNLRHEVLGIAQGRRRGIGDAVRGHDLEHALLAALAAVEVLAGGRVRRLHAVGGQTGLLNAGVHIRLVIVADEDRLIVAVDHAGQSLQADIGRAAVAGEAHNVVVLKTLCLRTGQNAAHRGRRTGEGRNHAVDIHGHMRIDKGNRRHAVRRNHRDRTLTQHLQRQADRQGRAAAGTGLMAIKEFLICHRLCVKRHKYPSSDSQSWPRQPWQSRPEAPHRSSQCRSCRCCGRPDRRRSSPRESPRPRSSARS